MTGLKMGSTHSGFQALETATGFSDQVTDLVLQKTFRILPNRREVYAAVMQPNARSIVVKRFLKHPKQVRDWTAEWNGLQTLHRKELPSAQPLCVLESNADGAIWVVMEQIEGAVSLGEYLDSAQDEAIRSASESLCALVDRVHYAGVRQTDQHIDNWAIANGKLYLLDAGTIESSDQSLSISDRLKDLAAICVTLSPPAEKAFRDALQVLYLQSDSALRERILAELDSAILLKQAARARKYYKKTVRDCTEFKAVRRSNVRGMYSKTASKRLVDDFFANPSSLMQEGTCLKDGNTCTVQGFERAGVQYVLKRYNMKPVLQRARKHFSQTRARTSWSSSWLLNLAFIPTARAVAYYEEQIGLLRGTCYLLMQRLEGQLLPEYVASHQNSPEQLAKVATSFAHIWSALGRLRAAHGDLKATNLIVDSAGTVHLFDLDAFKFGLGDVAFERGRSKDYNRFMRNWSDLPNVQRIFEAALHKEGTS